MISEYYEEIGKHINDLYPKHIRAFEEHIQKQKIKEQLKALETQQETAEETIEHTLPAILSIITTIPDNEIRVIATANKICIKHEDKIKLLELFRVIVRQLSDAYDVT